MSKKETCGRVGWMIVAPQCKDRPIKALRHFFARPDLSPRRREVAWGLFRNGEHRLR